MRSEPKISIVTAFLNEESNLPLFRQKVLAELTRLDVDYEVVLVDDHSSDASGRIAKAWAAEDHRVVYLRLARNCGSHTAFTAGLAHSTGDCAILLAADLQDPPDLIPTLLAKWRESYQVVWATRGEREDHAWQDRLFAGLYWKLMRWLALPEMPEKGADFVLLDRKVIDAYNAVPEKNTSFMAMILWLGFRQTSIDYVKVARHSGRSKWTLAKKIKLFIDSIVSFSYAPIRLMSLAGITVSGVGFLYAMFVVVSAFRGERVEGWASLMVVVLVLGGLQLLTLGVLGEYLWRSFDQSRGRPRYLLEEHVQSSATPDARRARDGDDAVAGARGDQTKSDPESASRVASPNQLN